MRSFPLFGLLCLIPNLAAAADPGDERVQMNLQRYRLLMHAAERAAGPQPVWQRGELRVELPDAGGRHAVVTFNGRVSLLGEGRGEVPLLPAEVVLEEASFDGSPASLVQRAGAHVGLLDGDSTVNVELRYVVPISPSDGGSSYLLAPLPAVPGVALSVEAGDRKPEVWPAANAEQSGSTLTASVPATPAVVVRWGDATGTHAVRRVDYRLTPDGGGDGMNVEARFEVSLAGRRGHVRLAPATVALMGVKEERRTVTTRVDDGWHVAALEGRGRHVIEARFRLAVDRGQGQPSVVLHPDRVPIAQVEVVVPGKRAVTFDPPVPLERTIRGEGDRATTRVVGYLPPTEEVTVGWTEERAAPESRVRINTATYQLVTLQEGVLRSRVIVEYEVIRGKTRELPVQIPEDVVLYKVHGDGIEDWRTFARDGEAPRQVRIALGDELEGKATVELRLETVVPREEGAALSLPLVRPIGAFREMGVVALFDGDKVGFAPAEQTGYTKVGEDALPIEVRKQLKEKVSQAFKHIGAPENIRSKVTAAQQREIRFDAHQKVLYSINEGSMTGRATVLIDVKRGRRDAVLISLPTDVGEPRVNAPSLNKVAKSDAVGDLEEGRTAYEISFTRALEGAVRIEVELERLLPKELGEIQVPDLRVHGAEVQEGSIGVTAETGVEVQEGKRVELRPVDAAELPKSVTLRSPREVVLGYRYTHAPWSLSLLVKRHHTVETLSAVVEQAWVETHVLESGHVISRATYRVANQDRHFIKLVLPEGAEPLSITAGGARVKAVRDEKGAIAIPLRKGVTQLIDLTYEWRRDPLGTFASVPLAAPTLDLRTSDLQWLVRTPRERSVVDVTTELKSVALDLYRPPEAQAAGVQIQAPPGDELEDRLYTYAVVDAGSAPPTLRLTFTAAAGSAVELGLFVLALLGLVYVMRRRIRGSGMRPQDWAVFALAVLAMLLKASVWSLSALEGLLAVVLLAFVALAGRRGRREEGSS